MNAELLLRDASVQEIQLELIRRTRFNDFDGEVIHSLLMHYRSHWIGVLLDRLGVCNRRVGWELPVASLIKLRDLRQDIWNADTIFVLTHTVEQAKELAVAFEESNTGAMPRVLEDSEEREMALGTGRSEVGLLKVWWD